MCPRRGENGPSLTDRLAEVVNRARDQCGSFERLSQEIHTANLPINEGKIDPKKRTIDRRKLKRISDCDNVSISLDELQALDTYLTRQGKGLAAILEKPSIIKSLVEKGRATFLLGSRPREERRTIELSRWDLRTVGEVLRAIYRVTPAVRINVEDVFLRNREDNLNATTYRGLFHDETWLSLLEDGDGPSLICIGSPRACHATELVLASMFSTEPFQRSDASCSTRLPFYFVWSQEQYDEVPSSFALNETALPNHADNRVIADWNTLALQFNNTLHPVYREGRTSNTYGIICAQRRRTGQVWVVMIGLNGPGTLASARLIDSVTTALPQGEIGRHSSVLWVAVEGRVEETSGKRGDLRELVQQQLFSDPATWTPKTN